MPTDGLVADLWGEAPRSRWCSCTSRSCARCSRGRGYDAARGRGRGGRSAFSRASSSPAGQETLWRYGAGHVLPTWPSSRSRRRRSGVLRSCASRRSSGRRRGHRGGRHREVLAELDALVGGEPLRGRLQAQRMLVVYRSGRQADALDAYRAARAGRWSRRSALSPGRSAAACTSDPATGSGARPVGRRRCPPSAGDLRRRAGLRPARRDRRRGAPGRSGGPGCGARRAAIAEDALAEKVVAPAGRARAQRGGASARRRCCRVPVHAARGVRVRGRRLLLRARAARGGDGRAAGGRIADGHRRAVGGREVVGAARRAVPRACRRPRGLWPRAAAAGRSPQSRPSRPATAPGQTDTTTRLPSRSRDPVRRRWRRRPAAQRKTLPSVRP